MYVAALRLRREHGLGNGDLEWLDGADEVIAFRNSGLTVVANMGDTAVELPSGAVVLASGPLPSDGTLPAGVTAWLR